jgi:hypothetical protein
MKGWRAAAFGLLLIAAAHEAAALTVYVRRTVTAAPGPLQLGDLVLPAGEVPPGFAGPLRTPAVEATGAPLYVPSAAYRGLLESGSGGALILVGRRTLVLPKGLSSEAAEFLDRLTDRLMEASWLGTEPAEIDVLNAGLSLARQIRNPVFTLPASGRTAGTAAARLDISCRGTSAAGDAVTGLLTLRIRPVLRDQPQAPAPAAAGASTAAADGESAPTAAGAPAVRVNDMVSVVFLRGALTVEMPGRSLTTAAAGDAVMVYVADARRNFSGTLLENKVVRVEIP